MRARQAPASGQDTMGTSSLATPGFTTAVLLPGVRVGMQEKTWCLFRMRLSAHCTCRGFAPPASEKEPETLYAVHCGWMVWRRYICSWP